MGWIGVVVGGEMLFLKKAGRRCRRESRRESEENVSPHWESSRLQSGALRQDPGEAIAGETLPRADHVCAIGRAHV